MLVRDVVKMARSHRLPLDQSCLMSPFLGPLLDITPLPADAGQREWEDSETHVGTAATAATGAHTTKREAHRVAVAGMRVVVSGSQAPVSFGYTRGAKGFFTASCLSSSSSPWRTGQSDVQGMTPNKKLRPRMGQRRDGNRERGRVNEWERKREMERQRSGERGRDCERERAAVSSFPSSSSSSASSSSPCNSMLDSQRTRWVT
ncbi:hypothetical protein IF1G_04925 [Cordyceps javanica]|uniref:Uncharacterized protein n=1 Tax=Cordyceps javanica TaxID=43265 RepID=A0A545W103_9HYPO|nr:hypothetical protein IF1G_04925 [Cordyceps javanica]TQW07639.1 hypothetical protein IF2G_04800 [Cordyceps javanica]